MDNKINYTTFNTRENEMFKNMINNENENQDEFWSELKDKTDTFSNCERHKYKRFKTIENKDLTDKQKEIRLIQYNNEQKKRQLRFEDFIYNQYMRYEEQRFESLITYDEGRNERFKKYKDNFVKKEKEQNVHNYTLPYYIENDQVYVLLEKHNDKHMIPKLSLTSNFNIIKKNITFKDCKSLHDLYYFCEYLQVDKHNVEKLEKIDDLKWVKFSEAVKLMKEYNSINIHNDVLNELKDIVIPPHLAHLENFITF